jgi:hypothetical protein
MEGTRYRSKMFEEILPGGICFRIESFGCARTDFNRETKMEPEDELSSDRSRGLDSWFDYTL